MGRASRHPVLSRPYRAAPSMTPLIDVVFLLIVFFMLVAQISRHRAVEMTLADVGGGANAGTFREDRVVIEVVGDGYRLGSAVYDVSADGAARLSDALALARSKRAGVVAQVRADRAETYSRIEGALGALRDAGFAGAELAVARVDEQGGG